MLDKPVKTLADKLAQAKARGGKGAAVAPPAKPEPAQLRLDIWPDAVRGVPNSFLRSALFGVSNIRKTYSNRTLIAAVDGYEIRFFGTSFNQTDLDVWETLLHLARLQPLGTKVEFTAHSLLKELGRSTGGKDHEQLKEELARLGSGWTEITDTKAKKTFAGNFISSFVRDDETERYVVSFTPEMAQLYEAGHTLIDWSERKALGKNNLAKWLHGHYASHASPFHYKTGTLRDLSGSDTTGLRTFRQKLKKALDALKAIGAILNWSIDDDDLVHVAHVPSRTQLKHLKRKKV
ncbi:plasmid replication initiator TrfA [Propionivibrio sp.]|uniref:plasmid replication initiator TrfA n=1 Tax=Propionivibrio sp. TaxID=2212460 RepID=UPI003BF0048E